MKFPKKYIILPLLAFSALNGTMGAIQANAAQTIRHEMKIILSLASIPIGKLAMTTNIANGYYSISGVAKTYGVTKVFSKARGSASSSGLYANNVLTNTLHKLNFVTKKKSGSTVLKMGKTGVEYAKVVPPVKIKPGTIIIEPSHLKSIQDPVRATLIAVTPGQIGNGAAICNRTLPIYDGKTRFDLKLHYKGTRKIVTRGFKGISYVCGVRYVPVAGHRPHKKNVQRMAANKKIEISLARIGDTALYGLIQFKVKTQYGTIVGKPSYFVFTKK